jgi:hypothetical protein
MSQVQSETPQDGVPVAPLGQPGFRGRGMGMRGMPTRGVAQRGRGGVAGVYMSWRAVQGLTYSAYCPPGPASNTANGCKHPQRAQSWAVQG